MKQFLIIIVFMLLISCGNDNYTAERYYRDPVHCEIVVLYNIQYTNGDEETKILAFKSIDSHLLSKGEATEQISLNENGCVRFWYYNGHRFENKNLHCSVRSFEIKSIDVRKI